MPSTDISAGAQDTTRSPVLLVAGLCAASTGVTVAALMLAPPLAPLLLAAVAGVALRRAD